MLNNYMQKKIQFLILNLILISTYTLQSYALDYVPGEFVVKLKKNPAHNLTALKYQMKAFEIRELNFKNKKVFTPKPSREYLTIKRDPKEELSTTIRELQSLPDVEMAEPNYIYELLNVPNDPDYIKQWGLNNSGQLDGWNRPGRVGVDIGAEKAWDITTGSKKVIVAVIDSGLNYKHPDIKENVWTNLAEIKGVAGVDDDNNGYVDDIYGYDFVNNDNDPSDDLGHGTHVSSIIGSKSNQGLGIAGINWDVSIMPLKYATADGKGDLASSIKAIHYAIKMGAQIINASWGNYHSSAILESAIREANDKNILFVAAAGNSSKNNDLEPLYPASYPVPNIISVAGLNLHGYLGSFSCYGPTSVHIAAPADSIYSLWNDKYRIMTGTSMAAPHVTGVAALLLAKESQLTALQLKERLLRTSRPLGGLRNKVSSGGMINAYYALANQLAPADDLDPTEWQNKTPKQISSAHPYIGGKTETWEFTQPNAKYISLYFNKIEIQKLNDTLNLFDRSGRRIARITSTDSSGWSPVIEGDYVKIVLTTDVNNSGYGFDISKIAFK